ncbi:MAG: hypothetical protein ISN26_07695, partial [Betaproteobacteria bacterium AqS2]|nr:hypothetical protein [Betaproteobacteria bacterium AqS2]
LNPSQGGQVTLSQEFVLGPEQVNDQMVQVLDDRFGVDFTGLSSRIEGNNPVTNTVQWTRGIYVKPGAVFAGPMSLTVLVRAGPDPRNFNAPGLREAVAAAISPSYQISEDNERLLTNYDQAGVSTLVIGIDSQPRLAIVGEQAILDPLSRLTVASGLTLVKSFHTGSLRYSDEGANLVLPGHDLIYHHDFDRRGGYEGDDRTEFPISVNMANARHALRSVGCGMYELPVTINARERVTNGGHRRRASAVFTLTLSGAAGVDGLATVSGTPRRRGPADVAADFATGLAFECAGPGFVFESSNAAFALAGAGERRGIVVRAGTANDDALTTRITYRQGEGSAARSFDLTIGVFSTIAVEGTPGATTGLPQLRVKGTLAGIPGASVTADHHLESGGAGIEYSGVGSFLLRGFTLTTYHEAAGATIYATTAFDAAAYNERLVQVDDDRFGIDFAGYAAAAGRQSFRGLYVKAGAVFTDPLVTITLALNSGAYLKDFATGALGRRIDEGGVKLLDPQVADAGFANTAAAEVALTLRVAPRAFVSGAAVTIETGSGNTSAVTTGLTLHVSYPGNVSIVSVNPAIKLGTEASGAWPISVNRVSIDSTYTVPEGCGISEMPVSLRINGHGAGALGADARFGLRLYDDDVVSTSTRPNFVVGAVPEFLLAGTLTAQMKTGYAINCAHSSFAASFSNSALEIIGSGAGREIAVKDDAVLTTPALTSRVVYQNGSNTNHTVFVTIPVLSTLAWTGAT